MYIAMKEEEAEKIREIGIDVVMAKWIIFKTAKETRNIMERIILYGEKIMDGGMQR